MMEELKSWWQSKTEITVLVGFLAVLLLNILPMLGVDTTAVGQAVQEESGTIVDQILVVVSGLSFLAAFVFRFTAKKRIK